MVPRSAHTSFHHIANTQLLRNLLKIPCDASLVLHDRSAADHFQVLDLGKIRKQFVLDSVGKVSVLFLLAQIFQRQYCNAFLSNWRRLRQHTRSWCWDPYAQLRFCQVPCTEADQTNEDGNSRPKACLRQNCSRYGP